MATVAQVLHVDRARAARSGRTMPTLFMGPVKAVGAGPATATVTDPQGQDVVCRYLGAAPVVGAPVLVAWAPGPGPVVLGTVAV